MGDVRKVFVAGSGGIGRAAALFLLTMFDEPAEIVLGDKDPDQTQSAVEWIRGIRADVAWRISTEEMPPLDAVLADQSAGLRSRLAGVDVILDCLPGHLAFQLAQLADQTGCDYVNVTEHVQQTANICQTLGQSQQRFLLQTGLAPGYINLLGLHLVHRLRSNGRVRRVETVRLRVGALSQLVEPPSYYAFTWSTAGVATEYLKPAIALRGGQKVELPSLSEAEHLVVDGLALEARLTSGGTADLCDALAGQIDSLDYKTLRFPGHYDWIDQQIELLGNEANPETLEARMKHAVPYEREDMVVLFAAAEGRDEKGIRHRESVTRRIMPIRISPTITLSAIQLTTASALAQSAHYLLQLRASGAPGGGVLQQSDLPPNEFLGSPVVRWAYSTENHPEFKQRLTTPRSAPTNS